MMISLVTLPLFSIQTDTPCGSYYCKEPSQVFDNETCVFYDSSSEKYYVSPCPLNYYCDRQLKSNSICVPFNNTENFKYPGEVCEKPSDCLNSIKGCENGVCKGNALNEVCDSSADCNPGLFCNDFTCQVLFPAGFNNCSFDYECINFAGCLENTCTLYWSKPDYSEISVCNNFQSVYCHSGMCDGQYCIPAQSTSGSLPKKCKEDADCLATQKIQGFCSCGLNEKSTKYCSLFPGDSFYANFLTMQKE